MSKVFFTLGMSLDGYIAGPNARPGNPLGDGGPRIHSWVYETATFCERLQLRAVRPGPTTTSSGTPSSGSAPT
jgi:hypothetical protein